MKMINTEYYANTKLRTIFPMEHDYAFKVVLVGDASVGKSSVILKYTNDLFISPYPSTIGIDLKIKTITIDDKICKLQIWDTAGQERFKTITQSYYRGANIIIIMYDVTHYETFSNAKKWLKEINDINNSIICKILVGNKNDEDCKYKEVDTYEASQYAHENNLSFFEISAKNNINIYKMFTYAAKCAKDKVVCEKEEHIDKKNHIISIVESDKKSKYWC